nr:hypothetical protein [Staphylococcus epidermidis]
MLNDGTLQATAQTRRYQASLEQVKSYLGRHYQAKSSADIQHTI